MDLDKFFKKYAHFLVNYRLFMFLFIMFITLIFLGGSQYVYTVSSFEKVLPNDVESVKGAKILRDQGMGQDGIVIALKSNFNSTLNNIPISLTSLETFKYLDRVAQELRKDTDTVFVYSPSDVIKAFNNGTLPETQEKLDKILQNPKVQQYLSNYLNYDKTMLLMFVTTDLTNDDSALMGYYSKVKQIVQESGVPSGVEIKITGSPAIQQTLAKLIERDQKVTQIVSTILVFLVTVLTFRSILAAVIPILIVTVANIWLQGWMGFFNISLSTLAAGVAALVIGIGIDYSIHFMSRFKYERRKIKSITEAVEEATKNTGVSLMVTALATIGAFLAFNIGKMPEMGKFGNLMALGIFFSLILTLTLLPILLIWEEKIVYWLLSRIRIGIEHEFRFALIKEAADIKAQLPVCSIEERERLKERLNEIKVQLKNDEIEKYKHLFSFDDKK
ncbi:MAG: MMPL family transporter [Nanoarchaeota archaeon]